MGTLCNIETERLLLRPLADEEWTMLVDRVSDAEESLFQFGIEADAFRKDMAAEPNREEVIYFAIVHAGSDAVIGYAGFAPRSSNLEFYVLDEYRRQGYAFEALSAFVQRCADGKVTGKPQAKIVTRVIIENMACIELMKKLGFTECGCGFSITSGWGFVEFEYVEGKG